MLGARRRTRFLVGNEGARQRGPNKLQRRKAAEIEEMAAAGAATIGCPDGRDLLIAGVMLYAGEGAKRDGSMRLANSDPRMIALFCSWLRKFFEVDESRLRVQLYLHQGLDVDEAIRFWAELTGIPATQFQKPYRAVPDPSIRHAKHPLGCPAIIYSCARTHRAVMGMIDALLTSNGSAAESIDGRAR